MEVSQTRYKRCDLYIVTGRVDSFTAPRLAEALASSTGNGRYNIVLDLFGVEYISSAGLRVMIDVQKTCKPHNGELLLVGVPKRIFETLELAGFVPLFRFFDNVTAAVADF